MKRCRSGRFLRLFSAVSFALCGFSGAGAFAAGLDLTVNWTAFVSNDPIIVNAHAAAIAQSFDAWAVILSPDGQLYFMSLAGTIAPGAVPLARAVPGLPSAADATLLSMRVPAESPRGEYAAVLVFLPAGTVPVSVEDAEAKAIPGYFVRTPFYVISGRISTDISGTWNAVFEGLGGGVLTINQPDYLVDGTFTGGIGNASLLGFIDLETFTLFLDFTGSPVPAHMTLKGTAVDSSLSGTYSSDLFDPPSGTWNATRQ